MYTHGDIIMLLCLTPINASFDNLLYLKVVGDPQAKVAEDQESDHLEDEDEDEMEDEDKARTETRTRTRTRTRRQMKVEGEWYGDLPSWLLLFMFLINTFVLQVSDEK